jgi:NDP-sugar pyrophosphorylase family protein
LKAVILVGGEGTRLRPLTYDIPKPMVPICGKPFVEYQLDLMRRYGVEEVIFSLGYKWNSFDDYFGDGSRFGLKINYVIEDEPLGTGGAIKNVEDYLDEKPFYVFNGDILSDFNLKEIMDLHLEKNSCCTLALTPVDNPTIYGVVEYDNRLCIRKFTEKPKPEEIRSNMINAGLYVMNRRVLDRMEQGKNYSIERQIFPALLIENQPLYCYLYDGYWMDIGNPSKYLTANHDVLQGKLNVNIGVLDGIYIAPDVEIAKGTEMKKPLWIGNGVKIGRNSKLVGPAIIDNKCELGENVHVNGCLLWENVKVGNRASMEYCIIGRDSTIGEDVNIGKMAVVGSNTQVEPFSSVKAEAKV